MRLASLRCAMSPPDADDHLQNLIRCDRLRSHNGLPPSNLSRSSARCRSSIFFSLHPFADIGSAILKLHAIRFATYEKEHYVTIDHGNVFQIENDVAAVRLEFKKLLNSAIAEVSIRPLRTNTLNPPRSRVSILKVIDQAI